LLWGFGKDHLANRREKLFQRLKLIRSKLSIIEADKVTKVFKKTNANWRNFKFEKKITTALDGVSVKIEEGELIGFLGPNGAGKTTFLKILSGILYPDDGHIRILGYDPFEKQHDYLRQIALVMGQKNQLWWDLPAMDSFAMLKEVYSIPDKSFKKNLELMIEKLEMKDIITRRLRSMSLGERMKCELTASFLHDPKIIFLDEPTIGLDVISARSVRKLLLTLNQEKKCTMILTSHYMGDVEALCKRVVIINHGKKIYDGGLDKLKEKYAPEKVIEIYLGNLKEKQKFAHLKRKRRLRIIGELFEFQRAI
jgi:ABC-2 type transport system ATP-binding protein